MGTAGLLFQQLPASQVETVFPISELFATLGEVHRFTIKPRENQWCSTTEEIDLMEEIPDGGYDLWFGHPGVQGIRTCQELILKNTSTKFREPVNSRQRWPTTT